MIQLAKKNGADDLMKFLKHTNENSQLTNEEKKENKNVTEMDSLDAVSGGSKGAGPSKGTQKGGKGFSMGGKVENNPFSY